MKMRSGLAVCSIVVMLLWAGCDRVEPGRTCSLDEMLGPVTIESGGWGYAQFNRDCRVSPPDIPGLVRKIQVMYSPMKLDWIQVHYAAYTVGGTITQPRYYGLGFWFHVAQ